MTIDSRVPGATAPPADELRRRPIGVFDSGVGGLTVLHELLVALPHEDFLYLGDTERFPYGDRSQGELEALAIANAEELAARGAKLLVVACNAATSAGMPALLERFGGPAAATDPPGGRPSAASPFGANGNAGPRAIDVIGVVHPESQAAVVATRTGRIGLLATPATLESGAYERALYAADPHVRLERVACPDLASIIQGGFPFDQHVVDTVRAYCEPLRAARVDTVILGCTHYPLVRPMLQRMLGRGVTLIASGAAIARRVECALAARELDSPNEGEGEYRFLCTGDPESFRALGTRFLQMPLGEVSHVDPIMPSVQPALAGDRT